MLHLQATTFNYKRIYIGEYARTQEIFFRLNGREYEYVIPIFTEYTI